MYVKYKIRLIVSSCLHSLALLSVLGSTMINPCWVSAYFDSVASSQAIELYQKVMVIQFYLHRYRIIL